MTREITVYVGLVYYSPSKTKQGPLRRLHSSSDIPTSAIAARTWDLGWLMIAFGLLSEGLGTTAKRMIPTCYSILLTSHFQSSWVLKWSCTLSKMAGRKKFTIAHHSLIDYCKWEPQKVARHTDVVVIESRVYTGFRNPGTTASCFALHL